MGNGEVDVRGNNMIVDEWKMVGCRWGYATILFTDWWSGKGEIWDMLGVGLGSMHLRLLGKCWTLDVTRCNSRF